PPAPVTVIFPPVVVNFVRKSTDAAEPLIRMASVAVLVVVRVQALQAVAVLILPAMTQMTAVVLLHPFVVPAAVAAMANESAGVVAVPISMVTFELFTVRLAPKQFVVVSQVIVTAAFGTVAQKTTAAPAVGWASAPPVAQVVLHTEDDQFPPEFDPQKQVLLVGHAAEADVVKNPIASRSIDFNSLTMGVSSLAKTGPQPALPGGAIHGRGLPFSFASKKTYEAVA